MTGRTKERIAQSKRARAGRSPLLTIPKWHELISSGHLVCRCHDVFLWCYLCFVLLRSRLYAFVEAAALRSIVLRYAGAPIATRVSDFFPFVHLEMSLFPSIFCTITVFLVLLVSRLRRTLVPSGWCFSTLRPRAGFFTSAYVRIQFNSIQ